MTERGKEPEQGPTRTELFRLREKVAELENENARLREHLNDCICVCTHGQKCARCKAIQECALDEITRIGQEAGGYD